MTKPALGGRDEHFFQYLTLFRSDLGASFCRDLRRLEAAM